jgi:hypothetical protein
MGALDGAGFGAMLAGGRLGALGTTRERQGVSVSGKVARSADSGELGSTKGPFWPQALSIAAPPTRACAVTRILSTFNMQRL